MLAHGRNRCLPIIAAENRYYRFGAFFTVESEKTDHNR